MDKFGMFQMKISGITSVIIQKELFVTAAIGEFQRDFFQ